MKLFSKNVLLPAFALFSYLFYLFWSAPLDLILQMYAINDLYIFNNSYMPIITVVGIVMFFLLCISYLLPFKHLYYFFLGLITFLLILMLLYNYILPYSYGMFTDNNSLSPERSLLGFSKAYYLLDVILILGSFSFTIWAIKNKLQTQLLTFFLIFYSVLNIFTFSRGVYSIQKPTSTNITLSSNHPNVFYFIFDGLGPRMTQYFLTNDSMPQDLTDWSKDFTFFDNVTTLSTPYTILSIPTMMEGYKRTPMTLLSDLINSNNINYADHYIKPVTNLFNDLTPNVQSAYISGSLTKLMPILLVKIYRSIPYFMRSSIVSEYSWKYNNVQDWVTSIVPSEISVKETSKATLSIFYSESTHGVWRSKNSPMTYENIHTLSDVETMFYHNTKDVLQYLSLLFQDLQKENIYDNTKIIISSDHGTHTLFYKPLILEFVKSISTPYNKYDPKFVNSLFTALPYEKENFILGVLPSLLMVKDFNTTNTKMKTDPRFLSLGDIRGSVESGFGLTNLPDYTATIPPKRAFNIPSISFATAQGLFGLQRPKVLRELSNTSHMEFTKVESVFPFKASTFKAPLKEITDVPPYEIVD